MVNGFPLVLKYGKMEYMFKKDKYIIVRQAISKDLAIFLYNYFLMQKQVYDTCLKSRYFSPFENIIGYSFKNKSILQNS